MEDWFESRPTEASLVVGSIVIFLASVRAFCPTMIIFLMMSPVPAIASVSMMFLEKMSKTMFWLNPPDACCAEVKCAIILIPILWASAIFAFFLAGLGLALSFGAAMILLFLSGDIFLRVILAALASLAAIPSVVTLAATVVISATTSFLTLLLLFLAFAVRMVSAALQSTLAVCALAIQLLSAVLLLPVWMWWGVTLCHGATEARTSVGADALWSVQWRSTLAALMLAVVSPVAEVLAVLGTWHVWLPGLTLSLTTAFAPLVADCVALPVLVLVLVVFGFIGGHSITFSSVWGSEDDEFSIYCLTYVQQVWRRSVLALLLYAKMALTDRPQAAAIQLYWAGHTAWQLARPAWIWDRTRHRLLHHVIFPTWFVLAHAAVPGVVRFAAALVVAPLRCFLGEETRAQLLSVAGAGKATLGGVASRWLGVGEGGGAARAAESACNSALIVPDWCREVLAVGHARSRAWSRWFVIFGAPVSYVHGRYDVCLLMEEAMNLSWLLLRCFPAFLRCLSDEIGFAGVSLSCNSWSYVDVGDNVNKVSALMYWPSALFSAGVGLQLPSLNESTDPLVQDIVADTHENEGISFAHQGVRALHDTAALSRTTLVDPLLGPVDVIDPRIGVETLSGTPESVPALRIPATCPVCFGDVVPLGSANGNIFEWVHGDHGLCRQCLLGSANSALVSNTLPFRCPVCTDAAAAPEVPRRVLERSLPADVLLRIDRASCRAAGLRLVECPECRMPLEALEAPPALSLWCSESTSRVVMCPVRTCRTRFCMDCGQLAHPGRRCAHLDEAATQAALAAGEGTPCP